MFLYSSQEKKGNGQKFSPLLKLHIKIMLKTLEIESCLEKIWCMFHSGWYWNLEEAQSRRLGCVMVWREAGLKKASEEIRSEVMGAGWMPQRGGKKKEKSDTVTLSSFPIDHSLIQMGLTFLLGFQQSTEQCGMWVPWHFREICTS